jgi:hypothetical protein
LKTGLTWKIIAALFAFSMLALSIERAWNIVSYSVTFGVAYGGTVYLLRGKIRSFFSGIGRIRYPAFLALSLVVSVSEEVYVYILGNHVAIPNIWLDIIIVPLEWAVWFSGWYYLISRKYRFTEGQALLAAGLAGILFEYSGKGFLAFNPLAMLIFFPTAIVIYSAIFILPMQSIQFTGRRETWLKYPIGVFVPYLLSIPVGLVLYFTFIKP